jgi:hypothetical protein
MQAKSSMIVPIFKLDTNLFEALGCRHTLKSLLRAFETIDWHPEHVEAYLDLLDIDDCWAAEPEPEVAPTLRRALLSSGF